MTRLDVSVLALAILTSLAPAALAPVISGSAEEPYSPVLTLFIPVPQWSDGTPMLPHTGQ